ncbi:hypothetical protein COCNU_03G013340 [Cocos nucifera]|uniref:Uncharacterized protein n=1 Tax=Cocos nucifera TaxID=13894 RepID=A0A8K0MZ68_COCNU|nr:hypothetical protein COCNU_03G013340 [Cocos nucifera]
MRKKVYERGRERLRGRGGGSDGRWREGRRERRARGIAALEVKIAVLDEWFADQNSLLLFALVMRVLLDAAQGVALPHMQNMVIRYQSRTSFVFFLEILSPIFSFISTTCL